MLTPADAFHGFAVRDTEAARAFYADVLGVEVTDAEMGGIIRLHLGGGTPTIVYPKPDHVPATYTILNFPVDDVEATVDEADRAWRGVRTLRGHAGRDRREGRLPRWRAADRVVHRPVGQRALSHRPRLSPGRPGARPRCPRGTPGRGWPRPARRGRTSSAETRASYDARSRLLVGSSSSSSCGAGSASSSAARVARKRSPPESVADQPVGRGAAEQEPGQPGAHRVGVGAGRPAGDVVRRPWRRRRARRAAGGAGADRHAAPESTSVCSSVVLPAPLRPGQRRSGRARVISTARASPRGGDRSTTRPRAPRCRAGRRGSRGRRGAGPRRRRAGRGPASRRSSCTPRQLAAPTPRARLRLSVDLRPCRMSGVVASAFCPAAALREHRSASARSRRWRRRSDSAPRSPPARRPPARPRPGPRTPRAAAVPAAPRRRAVRRSGPSGRAARGRG